MRRHDLDWLRVFGILLLFPFHTARVFDLYEPNYVENAVKSAPLTGFISATGPWFMPLLFLISGCAAYYALTKRSGREFVKERLLRLLVPFVLGVLIIVPPQPYFARLMRGTMEGNYFTFFTRHFFDDFSDITGYFGTFTPAHLWFILYLTIISLALLPLLLSLNKRRAEKALKLDACFQKPSFILLMIIPLTVSEALPDLGGKNIFYYALFFLLGYFLAANKKSVTTIDKLKLPALIGVALLAIPFYMILPSTYGMPDFSLLCIGFAFLRNAWILCVLIALLGYSAKYLGKSTPLLGYLNNAAFPVYVVHQTVIIALAYWICPMTLPLWVKATAIMLLSLVVSLLLYELSKRVLPLRILLGIKKTKDSLLISKGLGA